MALHLQNHWEEKPERHVVTIIGKESWARFQDLVQRGTNLYPDAHPHVKEFADMVTVGHVQQDYSGQDTSKKK